MAKYARFDPRNKKKARHKQHSIDRDFRIKEERSSSVKHRKYLRDIDQLTEDDYDTLNPHFGVYN